MAGVARTYSTMPSQNRSGNSGPFIPVVDEIRDHGVPVVPLPSALDFTGAGVTLTPGAGVLTLNITGGEIPPDIEAQILALQLAVASLQATVAVIESVRIPLHVAFSETLTFDRSYYMVYDGPNDAHLVLTTEIVSERVAGATVQVFFPPGALSAGSITIDDVLHPLVTDVGNYDDDFGYRVIATVGETFVVYTATRLELPADTTPPLVLEATVASSRGAIDVEFSEAVAFPDTDGWSATGHVITGVSGSGSSWTLSIAGEVLPGDAITLAWTIANSVVDAEGNHLAPDSTLVVNTLAYPLLTVAWIDMLLDELVLGFSAAVDVTGVSAMTLNDAGGAQPTAVASGSGTTTVRCTLSQPAVGASITLDIDAPPNLIADLSGLDFQGVTGYSVTLSSPPAITNVETDVYGTTVTLTFDEAVNVTGITGLALNGTYAAFVAILSGSGTDTVAFTVSPAVEYGETVTLDVASPNDISSVATGLFVTAASGIAVTNNVPSGPPLLWGDDFERADGPIGNGWSPRTGSSQVMYVDGGDAIYQSGSGYGYFENPAGGVLPADYIVQATVPHSMLGYDFWGVGARVNPSDQTGIRLFFYANGNVRIGNTTGATTDDVIPTITSGYPASWSLNQDHTIALKVVGDLCTIYCDGQEYGYATMAINVGVSGLSLAMVGQAVVDLRRYREIGGYGIL